MRISVPRRVLYVLRINSVRLLCSVPRHFGLTLPVKLESYSGGELTGRITMIKVLVMVTSGTWTARLSPARPQLHRTSMESRHSFSN